MLDSSLKRNLRARHVAMIALGGSIGTGLFLASGNTIYTAGPGGALIAYLLMGIMIYFLMTSLGEMATLMPTTGTFCDYSNRFVSPSFGFAMGYNYFYNWAITIAADLTASSILMQYWFPNVPIGVWAMGFLILISLINFMNVRSYGESQYWLSFIKVAAVILFILTGLLMICGVLNGEHLESVGFKNWTIGDAPFHGGFSAILIVFLVVGFSFQGTELVGVAAGEAENPRESVPRAIGTVFWRILLFYILAITVIAFLIPYTDSQLVNPTSSVAMSPFTLVFSDAGLKFAGTIVNLVIVSAVLSAANASMYTATRTLWYLGQEGQAPHLFSRVNKSGVPYAALIITILFGALSLLLWLFKAGAIFTWLVNLSALAGFIAWFGIAASHYRFRKAYLAQGRKLEDLPYKAKFYPFGPILAALLCIVVIFGQIFTTTFTWQNFLSNYIGLLFFLALWIGHKLICKPKVLKLQDCRLDKE